VKKGRERTTTRVSEDLQVVDRVYFDFGVVVRLERGYARSLLPLSFLLFLAADSQYPICLQVFSFLFSMFCISILCLAARLGGTLEHDASPKVREDT